MFEFADALKHDCELNVFLPFNTTFLCEITFLALTRIKSQYRLSLKNVQEILFKRYSSVKYCTKI